MGLVLARALIPPSILLVIMGDLMTVPVGTLFAGAIIPGLLMSSLYVLYIITLCFLRPALAPPLGAEEGPQNRAELIKLVAWSFAPAAFLITLVLGSIFAGWATPTVARRQQHECRKGHAKRQREQLDDDERHDAPVDGGSSIDGACIADVGA